MLSTTLAELRARAEAYTAAVAGAKIVEPAATSAAARFRKRALPRSEWRSRQRNPTPSPLACVAATPRSSRASKTAACCSICARSRLARTNASSLVSRRRYPARLTSVESSFCVGGFGDASSSDYSFAAERRTRYGVRPFRVRGPLGTRRHRSGGRERAAAARSAVAGAKHAKLTRDDGQRRNRERRFARRRISGYRGSAGLASERTSLRSTSCSTRTLRRCSPAGCPSASLPITAITRSTMRRRPAVRGRMQRSSSRCISA